MRRRLRERLGVQRGEQLVHAPVVTCFGVRIEQISKGVFQVNAGSHFPAFRRLEREGLIKSEWRDTENNRRAKYYALTVQGRARLRRNTKDWEVQTAAITRILEASLGEQ